jgi:hypothetical protein
MQSDDISVCYMGCMPHFGIFTDTAAAAAANT